MNAAYVLLSAAKELVDEEAESVVTREGEKDNEPRVAHLFKPHEGAFCSRGSARDQMDSIPDPDAQYLSKF